MEKDRGLVLTSGHATAPWHRKPPQKLAAITKLSPGNLPIKVFYRANHLPNHAYKSFWALINAGEAIESGSALGERTLRQEKPSGAG
jgi:hypothetical protein